MKSLSSYINESAKTDIYFPNVSSAMIFAYELEGQISDGYWENSHPHDHWQWVSNVDVHVDPSKTGYTGPSHRLRYSTEWLRKYVKRAMKGEKDYLWAFRVLNMGKMGTVVSVSDFNRFKDSYAFRVIVEHLPKDPVDAAGLEQEITSHSYLISYWNQVKVFFTDSLLKKYYSSSYDFSDFEDNLEQAEEAMNTQV